jgi:hypothetical protein
MMAVDKKLKSMRKAKEALLLKCDIGKAKYEFLATMFDLDINNIGKLNTQIVDIPGHIAFVNQAQGDAERWLSSCETEFALWKAGKSKFYADLKSETAKLNAMQLDNAKEWSNYCLAIQEAERMVRILKGYKEGLSAKLQLAQTLSANIRLERESYTRKMDKGSSKSRGATGSL